MVGKNTYWLIKFPLINTLRHTLEQRQFFLGEFTNGNCVTNRVVNSEEIKPVALANYRCSLVWSVM